MRLNNSNIETYVKKTYNINEPKITAEKKLHVIALLQKNYGMKGDCSLVSMTACTRYYNINYPVNDIYNYIENIAKKCGYNGNTYGTLPTTIWKIYQAVLKKVGIDHTVATNYIKGLAFNFSTIKKVIDRSEPIILSIKSANEGYYQDHSVVACGYRVYNNKAKFVIIQDNWSKSVSYIDYNTISRFSSLVY